MKVYGGLVADKHHRAGSQSHEAPKKKKTSPDSPPWIFPATFAAPSGRPLNMHKTENLYYFVKIKIKNTTKKLY